ncbi:hypothetical protein C8J56DRAFT_1037681 [Mycena floridula]|nr:hypothetical protein C8J56DRAFT_1037681 [Mycena floridula]
MVPSWDRDGRTAIDYLTAIGSLSKLGGRVMAQLGYIPPHKWTSAALSWWDAIPEACQETMMADIIKVIFLLKQFFPNAEWVEERTKEFEEMRFHQSGHSNKSPANFVQQRVQPYSFMFTDREADGPAAVKHILWTAPPVWSEFLNSDKQMSILQLLLDAELRKHSLISA